MQNHDDGDESDHHAEFAGGNVTLVTTKEAWDQKLLEAKREHKLVRHCSHFILLITCLTVLLYCHILILAHSYIKMTFLKAFVVDCDILIF